jgi:LysM repeat protein
VRPGDTLFRIALRFGVPMSRLMEANRIANASRIFVGQVLVIP